MRTILYAYNSRVFEPSTFFRRGRTKIDNPAERLETDFFFFAQRRNSRNKLIHVLLKIVPLVSFWSRSGLRVTGLSVVFLFCRVLALEAFSPSDLSVYLHTLRQF